MNDVISQRLLEWYGRAARRLPWRGSDDPYAVWVSEIMLQQTRVETVIPYYIRWMERFPTMRALAEAQEQDVLRVWEGLGYYNRARNLHRAVRQVISQHQGVLPRDLPSLQKLPGIGRYTAAAIASIGFGQDEATLDGNIRRVLARLHNLELPARSPEGENALWELARQHLPVGRAGDYNQAWMDLGSIICTPRNPACASCPLMDCCQSYALGVVDQRPVMPNKPAVPHYTVTAAVLRQDGHVLIAQRPESGLLGGMWEFPGGKREKNENLPACLKREIQEELGAEIAVGEEFGVYRHAYTHFTVTLHAFVCSLVSGEPRPIQAQDVRWVVLNELPVYPMGKIDRMIASQLQEGKNGSR